MDWVWLGILQSRSQRPRYPCPAERETRTAGQGPDSGNDIGDPVVFTEPLFVSSRNPSLGRSVASQITAAAY